MIGAATVVWSDSSWYVIVACAILLAVVAALYLTIGRKQQQIELGCDWHTMLSELPVAVVGKCFRMRSRVTSREFIATLMSLQNEGVLAVRSSKAVIDAELAAGLTEPVNVEALKLFTILTDAEGVMLLSSLSDKVTDRKIKSKLDTAYPKWKDVVDRVAKDIEPVASAKCRMKLVLRYLSYALILLALVTFSTLGLVASTALLVAGLATLGTSAIIREELTQVQSAAKELYEWLTELDSDEPLPQDVASWNELLIYARAFGIEQDVFARLKAELPQIAEDPKLISLDFWKRFEANAFSAPT
jgi:uncharacterized membrane protein